MILNFYELLSLIFLRVESKYCNQREIHPFGRSGHTVHYNSALLSNNEKVSFIHFIHYSTNVTHKSLDNHNSCYLICLDCFLPDILEIKNSTLNLIVFLFATTKITYCYFSVLIHIIYLMCFSTIIDLSLDETVRIDELIGGSHMDLVDCRSLCSASGVAASVALEPQWQQREARIAELELQALARQQEHSELRQLVSILTVQYSIIVNVALQRYIAFCICDTRHTRVGRSAHPSARERVAAPVPECASSARSAWEVLTRIHRRRADRPAVQLGGTARPRDADSRGAGAGAASLGSGPRLGHEIGQQRVALLVHLLALARGFWRAPATRGRSRGGSSSHRISGACGARGGARDGALRRAADGARLGACGRLAARRAALDRRAHDRCRD